jgi:hypothetical protein
MKNLTCGILLNAVAAVIEFCEGSGDLIHILAQMVQAEVLGNHSKNIVEAKQDLTT